MKFSLALLFPAALMGSSFSTIVTCGDGPIGGAGILSASCSANNSYALAQIDLSSNLLTLTASGGYTVPPPPIPYASAVATLDADFTLTITGSTGVGAFWPCLSAAGYGSSAELAGVATPNGPPAQYGNTCAVPPLVGLPFTFGQPFVVSASFTANWPGAPNDYVSNATLYAIEAVDANGNFLGDLPFTIAITPEPRMLLPMSLALALLAMAGGAPGASLLHQLRMREQKVIEVIMHQQDAEHHHEVALVRLHRS